MALWRANGYARTTVADICRAAGVSKALFYFYFPRKEDVLFEVGMLSTDAAHRQAREVDAQALRRARPSSPRCSRASRTRCAPARPSF